MVTILSRHSFLAILLLVLISNLSYARQPAKVARAVFTTSIVDREPVDQVLMLNNSAKDIFFFTDLRHFEGQVISHKWFYDNKLESVVNFKVNGPRWRVYSRKDVSPEKLGKWTVVVQNEQGQSLKASVFQVVEQPEQQIILPKSN